VIVCPFSLWVKVTFWLLSQQKVRIHEWLAPVSQRLGVGGTPVTRAADSQQPRGARHTCAAAPDRRWLWANGSR
jgi:hypothetical protein